MTRLVTIFDVESSELADFSVPREGVVRETAGDQVGEFLLSDGPLTHYKRTVVAVPIPGEQGRLRVTETIDYRLIMPYVGWLIGWPLRRTLRYGFRHRRARQPWWAPPQRIDAPAARMLGFLCGAALVTGYLNTLITQTIAFAAEEFHSSDSTQGVALAVIRGGIVISFAISALADRTGRRRAILICLVAGPITAVLGAFSTSMLQLTATQLVSRSFALALGIIIPIVAAEEMPRDARAYAISITSLVTALGAGMCVMVLKLADIGTRGWRLVYVMPLLGLIIAVHLKNGLPESRRFIQHRDDLHHQHQHYQVESVPPGGAPDEPRPAKLTLRAHAGRLVLLSVGLALLSLFVAPASQFQNRFLRKERGYSGGGIALFTLVTNTPGGIGVAVGGKLADRHGRRIVGAVSVASLAVFSALSFLSHGPLMWMWSLIAAVVGAATIPSLSVFLPELFPTVLRGTANGVITAAGVVGSAIGLIGVGIIASRTGHIGPVVAAMAVGPLCLAALVYFRFPETAHRELEDLNPEDRRPA